MAVVIHVVSLTPSGRDPAHAVAVNGWVLEGVGVGSMRLEVPDELVRISLTVCRPREAQAADAARGAAFALARAAHGASTYLDVGACLDVVEPHDRMAVATLTPGGVGSLSGREVPTYLYQAGHMARVDPTADVPAGSHIRPVSLTPDRRLLMSTVALEELWQPIDLRWSEAQVADTVRWIRQLAELTAEQVLDPICLVGIQATRRHPT